MAPVDPPFSQFLPAWLARQRWYTGKGTEPVLARVGGLRLQDPAGEVGIEVHLVLDRAARTPVLYQVPLTFRDAPLEAHEEALVATTVHSELGPRWVYDACHDPVGAGALLRAVTDELELVSDGPPGSGRARGHRTGLLPALTVRGSRVLRGEQSNTSIIFDTVDPDDGDERPVILKVFRVLHPGRNPDVEVQQALAHAGSTRVPRPVGDILGQWPAPDGGSQLSGHLALAQEFLPGAPDAWRVALDALGRGADLPGARGLGEATAEVHATLAAVLPTAEPDEKARAGALEGWRGRYAAACEHVPELSRHADRVERLLQAGASAWWPRLQRVHGDYHLGQVLDVPGRGWVLLDFEGEPLRPLAERTRPDLPQRDVAGMLRSFDYAAGSVPQVADSAAWAHRAREAFLDGYAHISRNDPRDEPALLHALELDKALYEVTYEARNRPEWVHIPLAGVERILAT